MDSQQSSTHKRAEYDLVMKVAAICVFFLFFSIWEFKKRKSSTLWKSKSPRRFEFSDNWPRNQTSVSSSGSRVVYIIIRKAGGTSWRWGRDLHTFLTQASLRACGWISKEECVQDCPDVLQNCKVFVGKNVQKSPKGKRKWKALGKSLQKAFVILGKGRDTGTNYYAKRLLFQVLS